MRHMRWLLVVFTMWTMGMPILGIAEEPTEPPTKLTLETLTQKVGTLEQTWDREKNFLEREKSLQQGQLRLDFSEQFNILKRENQRIVDDLSWEWRLLVFINSIVAIFVVTVLALIYTSLRAIMTKRMDSIAITLEDIAKKHNIERDWIENGRITLLSLSQPKADELQTLVRDYWGFKGAVSKVLADFEPMNNQKIVLFNKDICENRQDLIWEYIQKCPDDTVFVAYTTGTEKLKGDTQAWKKLITANMPATLFGQLMTAFRYQDALKRARS
ncbi:MAG: hypothetical protein HQL07_08080 [Nitrospirae bacterium]|nr:hypothetical protein [Magnetococcales bacterium]